MKKEMKIKMYFLQTMTEKRLDEIFEEIKIKYSDELDDSSKKCICEGDV